ncbi:MAG TPA: RusA family crossover junction endodeoxyribonuclease [Roseateles sp.]|nr:RusA family crossover junction endodeoxyribonuclease [Roseateles sp.]
MIRLTLPYPISANRYWQSFVPRGATRALVHLSTEAKAYKKQVAGLCFAAGISKPIAGRVAVTLQLYPHRPLDWQKRQRQHGAAWDDTVQCIDLTNAEKVLMDALNGIAFEDDKRVFRYSAERMEPDADGARVVISITALQVQQPTQAALLAEPEEEGAF